MGMLSKLQAVEWTGPAIMLAVPTVLTALTGVAMATIGGEALYANAPALKPHFTPVSEGILAANLIGWSGGMFLALINGAAQEMCTLQLLPLGIATAMHIKAEDSGPTVYLNGSLFLGYLYFGLFHKSSKKQE